MGQAFDREGNVLGEASGATKREVADALLRDHPDAHEIRIRSAEQQGGGKPFSDSPKPTPDRMLQFFQYAHLPEHLQRVSKPFCDLADRIVATDENTLALPSNPERTVCLRKLLEAKDCAVRALLYKG